MYNNISENFIDNSEDNLISVNNINVNYFKKLITPNELFVKFPMTDKIREFISNTRNQVRDILNGFDNRKILIVGPCSIHDIDEAKIYATKLNELSKQVKDKILIIMRVYFEKPRTTIGWKGLINDPDLDGTFNVNKGLCKARELLYFLANNGLPSAYEVLDTFTPQYISDLVSWSAIGARTTESQVHRQLVSGLSMPVGFKNSTEGNIQIAIDAIRSAKHSHCFYGITYNGEASIISTTGNNDCHIILRGSSKGPNYYKDDIDYTMDTCVKSDLKPNIMIDCSHGNSNKDFKNQEIVWSYILGNYLKNKNIFGFMLESNINEGSQKLTNPDKLNYGVSITDSCISFDKTIDLVIQMYNLL